MLSILFCTSLHLNSSILGLRFNILTYIFFYCITTLFDSLVICQIRSELEILAFVKQVLVSRVVNRNQKQVVRDREVQM